MKKENVKNKSDNNGVYKNVVGAAVLLVIGILFFYKFFFQSLHPFPGDLLISSYQPWKSASYLGYVPGSYPTKFQYFDTIRQTYPWREFAIQSIRSGSVPLWNPHNFSGHPLLANVQSAAIYPLNIVFFVASMPVGWSFLVMLQPILASIFMLFYARRLGIGFIGSIIASVAYGYSLFSIVFLEYNTMIHVVLWLPFLLWMIELLLQKWRPLPMIGLVFGIFAAATAGHVQLFGLLGVFVGVYVVFQALGRKNKDYSSLVKTGVLGLLGLGASAIQLIPTLELLQLSARVAHQSQTMLEHLLIQPWQLSLLLVPDLFGNPATASYMLADTYPGNALYAGVVTLVLATFSVLAYKQNALIRYFCISFIVLLVLTVRSPISAFLYTNIPILSASSPGNMLFITSFCLAILSGFGMDILVGRKITWKLVVLLTLLITLIGGLALFSPVGVYEKGYVISGGLLLVVVTTILFGKLLHIKGISKIRGVGVYNLLGVLLLAILVVDLFYYFHKFNSFVPKDLFYPENSITSYLQSQEETTRHWGYGPAGIEANFSTQFGASSPDGYDPLFPKHYGEFVSLSKEGVMIRDFDHTNRSDAVIAQGSGEADLAENLYRLKILDYLGTALILDRFENGSTEVTFPDSRFENIHDADGWKVYSNKMTLPRARLVGSYVVAETKEEFEKVMFEETYNASESALLFAAPDQQMQNCDGIASAHIIDYSKNSVSVQTVSSCPSILVLTDTYMPGWRAYVDGAVQREVMRVDWAFRGVEVEAGTHTVDFVYEPKSFSYGKLVTLLSIIVLGSWSLYVGLGKTNEH